MFLAVSPRQSEWKWAKARNVSYSTIIREVDVNNGGCLLSRLGEVKYPPLFTSTSANNCFSIYNTSLIAIPKYLLYFLIKWVSHAIFSPGSRQEVNITWYSEIEELIQSREKHYSLVLYILKVTMNRRHFWCCWRGGGGGGATSNSGCEISLCGLLLSDFRFRYSFFYLQL